jgi:hypothetical protein
MEALLVLFVIVRMLTNAAEDLHNAAKGRPRRPRLTDRINNFTGSGNNRYGARRYLADLWTDAWTDARTKRDAKRAKQAPAAQPDPGPPPAPEQQPKPKPSPRPRPDQNTGRPELRLVPPPFTPDPASPVAGPAAGQRRCNRPGCIYGQIIGTRPWPGTPGSSPDADQLCDRCGWLSSHFTGRTFDQRLAGAPQPSDAPPAPTPGDFGPSSISGLAPPPAGDNTPTPAQPAGKEDPMSGTTSGEITSVAAARSFADAMLVHNKEVMAEIERAQNSLSSRGISGPVIAELNSVREYYAQAGGRWEALLQAIGQHERLAEQVRATQGAAKDTSFYTNA